MLSRDNKTLLILLSFIFIVSAFFIFNASWNGGDKQENWKRVINSDGKGYYNYLPALFINHNLGKQKEDFNFLNDTPGGKLNKYWVGTAFLEAPFFSIAHVIAKTANYSADGYSKPYQLAISIATLFYLLLGIFFLYRTLLLFNVSTLISTASCLLIYFGTNLFCYTLFASSMSHVYSFFAISAFIYFSAQFFREEINFNKLYLAIFFFAIVFLIRPVNAIVIFLIPFLSGSRTALYERISQTFSNKKIIFISFFIFLGLVSMQLFVWYKQTGAVFSFWSYKNEGFYFLHPQIFNVLFSFSNGFFIYTPLGLLAFIGLFPLYKKDRFGFFSVFLFLIAGLYIISSWWCWNYSSGFGMRPMIDYYSVFAILLAFLIQQTSIKKHIIIFSIAFICIVLNGIQTYQYYNHILEPCQLDLESYKYLLGKTDKKYAFSIGAIRDLEPYNRFNKKLLIDRTTDFEKKYKEWTPDSIAQDPLVSKDNRYVVFSSEKEFGCNTGALSGYDFYTAHRFYLDVSIDRYEPELNSASDALLVIDVKDSKGNTEAYSTFKINEFPSSVTNTWKTMHHKLIIEKLKEKGSSISIYIWNIKKQKFYIDNIRVKIFGYY